MCVKRECGCVDVYDSVSAGVHVPICHHLSERATETVLS